MRLLPLVRHPQASAHLLERACQTLPPLGSSHEVPETLLPLVLAHPNATPAVIDAAASVLTRHLHWGQPTVFARDGATLDDIVVATATGQDVDYSSLFTCIGGPTPTLAEDLLRADRAGEVNLARLQSLAAVVNCETLPAALREQAALAGGSFAALDSSTGGSFAALAVANPQFADAVLASSGGRLSLRHLMTTATSEQCATFTTADWVAELAAADAPTVTAALARRDVRAAELADALCDSARTEAQALQALVLAEHLPLAARERVMLRIVHQPLGQRFGTAQAPTVFRTFAALLREERASDTLISAAVAHTLAPRGDRDQLLDALAARPDLPETAIAHVTTRFGFSPDTAPVHTWATLALMPSASAAQRALIADCARVYAGAPTMVADWLEGAGVPSGVPAAMLLSWSRDDTAATNAFLNPVLDAHLGAVDTPEAVVALEAMPEDFPGTLAELLDTACTVGSR